MQDTPVDISKPELFATDALNTLIKVTPGYALIPLTNTCRRFRTAINKREIWQEKIQREFPMEAFHFNGQIIEKGVNTFVRCTEKSFRFVDKPDLKEVYLKLFNEHFPQKNRQEKSLHDRLSLRDQLQFYAVYGNNIAIKEAMRTLVIEKGFGFEVEDEQEYYKMIVWNESEISKAKLFRMTPYFLAAFNGQATTLELFHTLLGGINNHHFTRWTEKSWYDPLLSMHRTHTYKGSHKWINVLCWACCGGDFPEVVKVVKNYVDSAIVIDDPDLPDTILDKPYNNEAVLLEAIRYGRINTVGFCLNQEGTNADTYLMALMYAIEYGHENVFELVLSKMESNSDWINQDYQDFGTPLSHAVLKDNLGMVMRLVEKGVTSLAPIALACELGHKDIVEFLLQNKAKVDATTLKSAILSGDKEIVNWILTAGANFEFSLHELADFVWDVMFYSNKNRHLSIGIIFEQLQKLGATETIINLLQKRYNKDEELAGFNLLLLATRLCSIECMRILINAGANVDFTHQIGTSALHIASGNSLEAVELLLAHNASITQDAQMYEFEGVTPLHVACFFNQVEIAQLLIDKGAPIEFAVNQGFTPLHAACHRNAHDCVKLLLDNQANFEIKSTNDLTPLMLAVESRCVRSTVYLLEAGADIHAADIDGRTAEFWMSESFRDRVIQSAEEQGAYKAIDALQSLSCASRPG